MASEERNWLGIIVVLIIVIIAVLIMIDLFVYDFIPVLGDPLPEGTTTPPP